MILVKQDEKKAVGDWNIWVHTKSFEIKSLEGLEMIFWGDGLNPTMAFSALIVEKLTLFSLFSSEIEMILVKQDEKKAGGD